MKCLDDIREWLLEDEFGDAYWTVKYSRPFNEYTFTSEDGEVRSVSAKDLWDAKRDGSLHIFLTGALTVDVELRAGEVAFS